MLNTFLKYTTTSTHKSSFVHGFISIAFLSILLLGTQSVQSKALFDDMFGGSNPAADDDGTITLNHQEGGQKPSALIVLMHGLGDSSNGWSDVAQMWHSQLPYAKFILPTAPTQPVSMNGGFKMASWYDITGLDERVAEQDSDGIDESRSRIESILQKEHTENGIPYDRMVLSGFSQGGAMSLFTGLQMPPEKKLAGLVCFSGYLAASKKFALSDAGKNTPVFHGHGTNDPMVQFSAAEKTKKHIQDLGHAKYEMKAYRGMQHSVIPEELNDALGFLKTVIPRL